MAYFLLMTLTSGTLQASTLRDVYDKIMSTSECRQAPVNSGVIEYEVSWPTVDGGQIEIDLTPAKVVLQWGTTSQTVDFNDGTMIHEGLNPKTQKAEYSEKKCFENSSKMNCDKLAFLYWNILLDRPRKYLVGLENPNVDHMNSVVCAQNLIKTFSEFFIQKQ